MEFQANRQIAKPLATDSTLCISFAHVGVSQVPVWGAFKGVRFYVGCERGTPISGNAHMCPSTWSVLMRPKP